ncbi:MAG TPA: hypothetical protein VI248_02350 [Kineosporiaceae bacterium]
MTYDVGSAGVLPAVSAPMWTHVDTAAWLRVDPLELTRLIAIGAGPMNYWVGGHRRYLPGDVLAWLRRNHDGARLPRHARPGGAA